MRLIAPKCGRLSNIPAASDDLLSTIWEIVREELLRCRQISHVSCGLSDFQDGYVQNAQPAQTLASIAPRQPPVNSADSTEAHGNLASRIGHPPMKNAARDHPVSLSECQLVMAYIKSATTILGLLKELVTLSSHERLDLFPCATAVTSPAIHQGFATAILHMSDVLCPWLTSLLTVGTLLCNNATSSQQDKFCTFFKLWHVQLCLWHGAIQQSCYKRNPAHLSARNWTVVTLGTGRTATDKSRIIPDVY